MAANELDVRQLRKPDKHPTIFATYAALAVGRRSRRQFTAGPDEMRYFTVHQRRRALVPEPLKSPVRQAV